MSEIWLAYNWDGSAFAVYTNEIDALRALNGGGFEAARKLAEGEVVSNDGRGFVFVEEDIQV